MTVATTNQELRVGDFINVRKWPENDVVLGRVKSVLNGAPASWEGVYYEALSGDYAARTLFAFKDQIIGVVSSSPASHR